MTIDHYVKSRKLCKTSPLKKKKKKHKDDKQDTELFANIANVTRRKKRHKKFILPVLEYDLDILTMDLEKKI